MKQIFTAAIIAFFLFTGAASAQMADTFNKKQKLQWIKDATNLAARFAKLRNDADNLRKRYYAAMQSSGDSPLIVAHATYIDETLTDQTACESDGGTWADDACAKAMTQAQCEATDGFFWYNNACASMPVTISSDYQLMSPASIDYLLGSFDDFVDDWMDGVSGGTVQTGNGTNIWKAIRSE